MRPDVLSSYPYVVVRLACTLCGRRGSYKLARLAARFGSECVLEDVISALAADCPARRPKAEIPKRFWREGCRASFPDLDFPRPPSDLPPGLAKLRLVKTGS